MALCSTGYSQTIEGTVSDSLGTVPFSNVLIKRISHPNLIFQFASTDKNGFYRIELKEKPELLFIEFTSFLHEPKRIELKNSVTTAKEIHINVQLQERINKLNEVTVETKMAVRVTKDTVTFDPNSFKDGTERVVEDILKKLPGVEVAESGEIKYKGKNIKKLLLDGDDLFDSQYKIGSKNISADMIDKVQGIEHYEENSLLKGIRDSDDVALNLVLKKGKTDVSANVNLGYGYKEIFDNNLSAVLVNSKIKGFGIISHNNNGQNNTPYNAISNFNSFDRSEEKHSKTLISQGYFSSILDSKFHSLNSNFYASGNTLFKIQKKSSLKINIGFYDDKISRINRNNSNYSIGDENFSVSEKNVLSKKPVLYDLKANYSNQENEKFHWDYFSKLNYSKTSYSDFSNNNGVSQNNSVKTENVYIRQNINSTHKINQRTVIVSKLDYSKSNAPQNLSLFPGTIIDNENSLVSTQQQSRYDNQLLNLKSSLYTTKDSLKYGVHAEYLATNSKLNSVLKNENNNPIGELYNNNNSYKVNMFSVKPVIVYQKSNYTFRIGLNTFLTDVDFKNNIEMNATKDIELISMPSLNFNYKFNKKSILTSSYDYNAVLPEEDKMFTGIVQNNYRSFSSNTISLDFLKTHSYNLGYSYNDFYNFQQLSINLNHNYRPNNYFSSTLINENITVNNSFIAQLSTKDYNLNLAGEAYFHPLRTTFKFNGNYALSYSKNTINNSEIRDIKSNLLHLDLTARIGIKSKISLENNLLFTSNSFEVTDNKTNFQSLINQTKVIFKPTKEIKMFSIANIISPDLKQNTNYLFLEYEINYTPLNKKYGISLIAKNLTNNKTFETRSISDFSSSTSSHNLIERYIMLKVSFSL